MSHLIVPPEIEKLLIQTRKEKRRKSLMELDDWTVNDWFNLYSRTNLAKMAPKDLKVNYIVDQEERLGKYNYVEGTFWYFENITR